MLSSYSRRLICSAIRGAASTTAKPIEIHRYKSENASSKFDLQSLTQKFASIKLDSKQSDVEKEHLDLSCNQPLNSLSTSSLLLATSGLFSPNLTSQRFLMAFRRRKMNKHKRRKRFDRDYYKYQKYHMKKKAKAENIFRQQMNAMMKELKTFDPLEHVKSTIQSAKREWSTSVVASGRKKYSHWHELMSLDEIYGLKPDSYIDKKAGRPSEEDIEKIEELRAAYFKDYVRKKSTSSTEN